MNYVMRINFNLDDVNKLDQKLEHFSPDGKSLGFLNSLANTYLRCQIAENCADGYYLIFNNEKIEILPNGEFKFDKNGLYDTELKLLNRIFHSRRNKSKINSEL
jgi:hypothetical protein